MGMTVRGRISRQSSTASAAVILYRTGPVIGKRTPPKVYERRVDLKAVGDLTHAVVEDRVAGDPEHAVLLAVPAEREAHDVTATERLSGGP